MGSPKPSRILGAFGLNTSTSEGALYDEFARYGKIEKCELIMDRRTGRSRGFAFVYYENVEDAKRAKEEMNGMRIDGANIRVDYSLTKRAHTPTPGQYMGRASQRLDEENRRGGRGGGDYERRYSDYDRRYSDYDRRYGDYDRRSPPRRSYDSYDRDRGYGGGYDRDRGYGGGYDRDRGYGGGYDRDRY